MINKVILVGNVGKDPEFRQLDDQKQLVKFPLATSEKYNGNEKTEWHNIVIWGKLADIVQRYVNKGQMLYLEGKIQTRSWDDADGNKKYSTEIVCFNMQMLGAKSQPKNEVNVDDYPENSDIDNDGLPF